jgi:hypothetical protein
MLKVKYNDPYSDTLDAFSRREKLLVDLDETLLDEEELPPNFHHLDLPFEFELPEPPAHITSDLMRTATRLANLLPPSSSLKAGINLHPRSPDAPPPGPPLPSPLPCEQTTTYILQAELEYIQFILGIPTLQTRTVSVTIDPFVVYDPRHIPLLIQPDAKRWRSAPGDTPLEYEIEISSTTLGPADKFRFTYRLAVHREAANKGVRIKKVSLLLREHRWIGSVGGRVVRLSSEVTRWESKEDSFEGAETGLRGAMELEELRPRRKIADGWWEGQLSGSNGSGGYRSSRDARPGPGGEGWNSDSVGGLGSGFGRQRYAAALVGGSNAYSDDVTSVPRANGRAHMFADGWSSGPGGDGLYAEIETVLQAPDFGWYVPSTPRNVNTSLLYPPLDDPPYAHLEVRHSLQVRIELKEVEDPIVLECNCTMASIGKKECEELLDEIPHMMPNLDYDKLCGQDVWLPTYSKRDPFLGGGGDGSSENEEVADGAVASGSGKQRRRRARQENGELAEHGGSDLDQDTPKDSPSSESSSPTYVRKRALSASTSSSVIPVRALSFSSGSEGIPTPSTMKHIASSSSIASATWSSSSAAASALPSSSSSLNNLNNSTSNPVSSTQPYPSPPKPSSADATLSQQHQQHSLVQDTVTPLGTPPGSPSTSTVVTPTRSQHHHQQHEHASSTSSSTPTAATQEMPMQTPERNGKHHQQPNNLEENFNEEEEEEEEEDLTIDHPLKPSKLTNADILSSPFSPIPFSPSFTSLSNLYNQPPRPPSSASSIPNHVLNAALYNHPNFRPGTPSSQQGLPSPALPPATNLTTTNTPLSTLSSTLFTLPPWMQRNSSNRSDASNQSSSATGLLLQSPTVGPSGGSASGNGAGVGSSSSSSVYWTRHNSNPNSHHDLANTSDRGSLHESLQSRNGYLSRLPSTIKPQHRRHHHHHHHHLHSHSGATHQNGFHSATETENDDGYDDNDDNASLYSYTTSSYQPFIPKPRKSVRRNGQEELLLDEEDVVEGDFEASLEQRERDTELRMALEEAMGSVMDLGQTEGGSGGMEMNNGREGKVESQMGRREKGKGKEKVNVDDE